MTRTAFALVLALLTPSPAWADELTPLVTVPGGTFLHPGSNDGLRLQVDTFALERTPVTWRQFKGVMGATPHWTAEMRNHEDEFPSDAPVVYVTWYGAEAYAKAIGRRLPTEVEWEYAAAGGFQRQAHTYAPDEKKELRWYGGAKKEPQPVGQGTANAYGLFDLHGNVWEWVEDVRGNYTRQDARDPGTGNDNLGCGNVAGDDGSYAWFLRAAVRAAARKEQGMRFRGFRCAR